MRILLGNLFQGIYLQLGSFAVLFHVLNNLQGHAVITEIIKKGFRQNQLIEFERKTYRSMSLTLTTRPKVPSPSVAMILSEIREKDSQL